MRGIIIFLLALGLAQADEHESPPPFADCFVELTPGKKHPGQDLSVFFALDESRLSREAQAALGDFAWLVADKDVRLTLESHADIRASDEYNMALGQRRLDSVEEFLETLGVDRSRMISTNWGEGRPHVPGATTEEGHSQNRRVCIKSEGWQEPPTRKVNIYQSTFEYPDLFEIPAQQYPVVISVRRY